MPGVWRGCATVILRVVPCLSHRGRFLAPGLPPPSLSFPETLSAADGLEFKMFTQVNKGRGLDRTRQSFRECVNAAVTWVNHMRDEIGAHARVRCRVVETRDSLAVFNSRGWGGK